MLIITPRTCRAARALLGWTQEELAEQAMIGLSTVRNFESKAINDKTKEPVRSTRAILAAMQLALERAGIAFSDGDEPGVKLRAPRATAGNGEADAAPPTRPGRRGGSSAGEAQAAA